MTQNALPRNDVQNKTLLEQAGEFFSQGNYAAVVSLYQKILLSTLNDDAVWGNLGIALRHLGHYATAALCLKRAAELSPNSPGILRHYALCLCFMNRKDESLQAFAAALRLAPQDFLTLSHYGYALREFDMNEEALEQYDAAFALEPKNIETRWCRTELHLRLGRMKEGWKDFETRWQLGKKYPLWPEAEMEKTFKSLRWTGEDINGKTLLVYAEQGFGDTILCSRYLPLVKARGARVIFKCKPHLHRLLHTIPGIDRLVESEETGEKIDYHVPVMSLLGVFGTELSSIPPVPSLYIPDAPSAEAARLLAPARERFRVGIVWSGSPTYASNYKRAAAFTRFLPFAEIPGVQLYSLQKGPNEQELADCGAQGLVTELGPHLQDFADTAAALKQLDLVIMTDSSVAHLAGSIGCPVWNLLSNGAYWLYLTERGDSPWYPSMRLFRQPEPGDWDGVFKKVTAELPKAVALKKAAQWPWRSA